MTMAAGSFPSEEEQRDGQPVLFAELPTIELGQNVRVLVDEDFGCGRELDASGRRRPPGMELAQFVSAEPGADRE